MDDFNSVSKKKVFYGLGSRSTRYLLLAGYLENMNI